MVKTKRSGSKKQQWPGKMSFRRIYNIFIKEGHTAARHVPNLTVSVEMQKTHYKVVADVIKGAKLSLWIQMVMTLP